MMATLAKRCTFRVGYASVMAPALQRASLATKSSCLQPRPCQSVQDLQAEHSRIHDTMCSLARMLRVVQSEIGAGTVRASRLKDLNKFLTFSKIYGQHHHNKTTVMFNHLQRENNKRAAALRDQCDQVAMGVKQLVSVHDQPDVELKAETDKMTSIVKQLCKATETFPELEQIQFKEGESEFLERAFEDMYSRRSLTITAMESLSDELIETYKV
mmetsp:Transcript_21829/g.35078  ORF Transcript_21829/g.35078 Transcript_21829/m.35078 type:complete len:214 (+) Transcript_21829:126-767(+)